MEVASEGTNLMKKVHPDEHIVPSLDLLQNAVAFEFTSAPDHVCSNRLKLGAYIIL